MRAIQSKFHFQWLCIEFLGTWPYQQNQLNIREEWLHKRLSESLNSTIVEARLVPRLSCNLPDYQCFSRADYTTIGVRVVLWLSCNLPDWSIESRTDCTTVGVWLAPRQSSNFADSLKASAGSITRLSGCESYSDSCVICPTLSMLQSDRLHDCRSATQTSNWINIRLVLLDKPKYAVQLNHLLLKGNMSTRVNFTKTLKNQIIFW